MKTSITEESYKQFMKENAKLMEQLPKQEASPKISGAILVHSIVFPGASLSGDSSVNEKKYPGLKMEVKEGLLWLRLKGKVASTPLSNVKSLLYE